MEVDITEKINRWLKIGAALLAAAAITAAVAFGGNYGKDGAITVRDAKIAGVAVGVKTRAAGKLVSVAAEEGKNVAAGDVVATVEVSITEDDVAQLEQNLELAKQNLEQLKKGQTVTVPVVNPAAATGGAELAAAEARLKRMNDLFEMGAISKVKRDEAASQYEAAKSVGSVPSVTYETKTEPTPPETLAAAEIIVRQSEAALANAKSDRASTEITAPVAGTVHLSDKKAGDELKAGDTLMVISDAENLWIEAILDEGQKKKVKPGQFVSYEIDGHKLNGTVTSVEEPQEAEETATDGGAPESIGEGKAIAKISLPAKTDFVINPNQKISVEIFAEKET